jgi:formate dehydrogenase major subunit
VTHFTTASVILREDFRDTEELDGLFSGWNANEGGCDPAIWLYEGDERKQTGGSTPGHSPAGGGHGKDRGGEASELRNYKRDLTLEHPRCVYPGLEAALFALYTADGRAVLRNY